MAFANDWRNDCFGILTTTTSSEACSVLLMPPVLGRVGAHTSVTGGRQPLFSSGVLLWMSHRSKAAPAQSCPEKLAQGKLFINYLGNLRDNSSLVNIFLRSSAG